MSEGLFSKTVTIIRSTAVTATVFAMDYVLVTLLIVAGSLFAAGLMLISAAAGLFMALLGSVVVLYMYVGFCQVFADHRGARHA